MKRTTPEGQLQRLVIDWLAAKHIFSMRMNSGTLMGASGRPVTFGIPGCTDILAFPRNPIVLFKGQAPWETIVDRFIPTWIELKAPKGKQSDLQKSFQAQVEAEGHRYLLVHSLEELEAQL